MPKDRRHSVLGPPGGCCSPPGTFGEILATKEEEQRATRNILEVNIFKKFSDVSCGCEVCLEVKFPLEVKFAQVESTLEVELALEVSLGNEVSCESVVSLEVKFL